MQATEIHAHARKLLDAHGAKAIAEAARKAADLEGKGYRDQAETWRRIEAALRHLRGPHQG
jgi:hypothetical protein